MAGRKGALAYITENLKTGTGFIKEWQSFTPKDQADMKRWAEEEQDALGLVA